MLTIEDDINYCLERGNKAIKKYIKTEENISFYYGLDKYEKTGIILNNTIRCYQWQTSDDEVIREIGEIGELFPIIKKIASFNNVEVCDMPSFIAYKRPHNTTTQIVIVDNLYEIENSTLTYVVYTVCLLFTKKGEQKRIFLRHKCLKN